MFTCHMYIKYIQDIVAGLVALLGRSVDLRAGVVGPHPMLCRGFGLVHLLHLQQGQPKPKLDYAQPFFLDMQADSIVLATAST